MRWTRLRLWSKRAAAVATVSGRLSRPCRAPGGRGPCGDAGACRANAAPPAVRGRGGVVAGAVCVTAAARPRCTRQWPSGEPPLLVALPPRRGGRRRRRSRLAATAAVLVRNLDSNYAVPSSRLYQRLRTVLLSCGQAEFLHALLAHSDWRCVALPAAHTICTPAEAAPARATGEAPHRVCTAAPFPGLARMPICPCGGLRGIGRWRQRRGGCPQPRFTPHLGLAWGHRFLFPPLACHPPVRPPPSLGRQRTQRWPPRGRRRLRPLRRLVAAGRRGCEAVLCTCGPPAAVAAGRARRR